MRPGVDDAPSGETSDEASPTAAPVDAQPEVQWAPPAERRRRRWPLALWIGIPAAAVIAGAWWAGTNLIAPGVTVAGVPIGGLTADAAAERISDTIAQTAVDVTVNSSTATIAGADLGASLDAGALANDAFSAHPLWQVGGWFPESDPVVPVIDEGVADQALAEAFADIWTHPVNAEVAFDPAADSYVVHPGVDGSGVDTAAVAAAYTQRLTDADAPAAVSEQLVPLTPAITTETASTRADELNAMLAAVGFYVGEERTVPVAPATMASWLTLTADTDAGAIVTSADENAIATVLDGLAAAVNREPVTAVQVVNNAGSVLRTNVEGLDGRVLETTDGIAAGFATQLAAGNAAYQLPVAVTPHETESIVRLLEVDLSEQHLYIKENGQVIDSWTISSGKPGWETNQGHFTVNWKVRMQDMGNATVGYLQPDVEWVMYFSGDQAFHAVYWRPTTAVPMSHGCVGMPTSLAKQIYEWADVGTDVWVHA